MSPRHHKWKIPASDGPTSGEQVRDTADVEEVAALAEATFWYVLPTLPMFLVLPAMLRNGIGFWLALGASCLLTIVLYAITMWLLQRAGLNI
jgi:hypothetical protein